MWRRTIAYPFRRSISISTSLSQELAALNLKAVCIIFLSGNEHTTKLIRQLRCGFQSFCVTFEGCPPSRWVTVISSIWWRGSSIVSQSMSRLPQWQLPAWQRFDRHVISHSASPQNREPYCIRLLIPVRQGLQFEGPLGEACPMPSRAACVPKHSTRNEKIVDQALQLCLQNATHWRK